MTLNKIKTEILVIGSGAGGATSFLELANNDFQVLLIEEGSDLTQNYGDPISSVTSLAYRNGGAQPILSFPPITIAEGRMLGGTTEINGGLFWRTPEKILNSWIPKFDGLFIREDFEIVFEELEKELGVDLTPISTDKNKDSQFLDIGARSLGYNSVSVPRLVPNCEYSNRCGSGCPNLRKNSMSQTFIAKAVESGGVCLTQVRAEKIVKLKNGTFKVIALQMSSNTNIEIFCKQIFLACGAIQTQKLLVKSKLIQRKKLRLGFHCNYKVIARFPFKVDGQNGTIFNKQIQEFMDEGFLIMATNLRPEYLALACAGLNVKTVKDLFENISTLGLYTTQLRPSKFARVIHLLNQTFPIFYWRKHDLDLLRKSLVETSRILFASGANEIYLPSINYPINNFERAEQEVGRMDLKKITLQSVHIMSSLPIGIEKESKVEPSGQLKSNSNIYIVDSSVLPTTIGESPQGTIMAFSRLISRKFIKECK